MRNFEPTVQAGCARLAEVQVSAYASTRNSLDAKYQFVFDVGWRTYWRHVWMHVGDGSQSFSPWRRHTRIVL